MLNESGYTLGDCWAWMFAHNANKMIDAINGDTDDAKWKARDEAFEKTIAPLGEDFRDFIQQFKKEVQK